MACHDLFASKVNGYPKAGDFRLRKILKGKHSYAWKIRGGGMWCRILMLDCRGFNYVRLVLVCVCVVCVCVDVCWET